jgi:cellulose synthase/poly-beta-1,6-N-acetylglucosamine synthase-like glycosyltransferase
MTSIGSFLLSGFAALLAVPTATFFLEIVAATFLPRRKLVAGEPRSRRIAVLIPAHNESAGLQPTLEDVKSQICESDRLIVVADNCTDDTADVAARLGAEVTVRHDLTKIGKGYALDWGLSFLTDTPPYIVIIIDADCRLQAGTIDRLAEVCANTQQPVQSLYLMTAPEGSTISHQVAEFAWRVKNLVRPLGLNALGLPSQLVGSGMAFPWKVIAAADVSSGSIVEDLKLGLELAAAGHPAVFCPQALVTSTFPASADGTQQQRQRWEHGHVALILTRAPALLYQAARRRDIRLLALVLDLLVPPLSLLGIILVVMTAITGLAALIGVPPTAFIISATCLVGALAATMLAWFTHGRDLLPPHSLGLILSYVSNKLPIYSGAAFGRRVSRWIRADRGATPK